MTSQSNRGPAAAVGVLFFVNGATFSNWLPRIPDVRDRLGVGNSGLGAALIGGGLGGILASFLAAKLFARFTSSKVVAVAAITLACCLPLIAVVPTPLTLMVLLSVLGFLDVFNDLAMNTQGVIVQQRIGRSIMNRLHGGWSLGFVVGAIIGSFASAWKVRMGLQLVVVAVILIVTVLIARRRLIPVDPLPSAIVTTNDSPSKRPFLRSPIVLAMATAAIGAAFLESLPNDWSAVSLRDVFHAGRWSGVGSVAFAGAMLAGRLSGDHVLDRLGTKRLLTVALCFSAVGITVVVSAPVTAIAIIGFAVWGLGVSVLFPQLYAMAATLPGTSSGAGLGAMAIGQRFGFLLAPAAVGAIADWKNLRAAFAIMGIVAIVLMWSNRHVASTIA